MTSPKPQAKKAKAKFPGPWEVALLEERSTAAVGRMYKNRKGQRVPEIVAEFYGPDFEANARLFVCSPKLLEAAWRCFRSAAVREGLLKKDLDFLREAIEGTKVSVERLP